MTLGVFLKHLLSSHMHDFMNRCRKNNTPVYIVEDSNKDCW